MVNLSTLQHYLASDSSLLVASSNSINIDEEHLCQWAALLATQTETQQAEQIEKVLTELRLSTIDDRQRLTLIKVVMDATNPLIAAMRQHYIYESGALSKAQLERVAIVKSLHYSMIMTYDGVIHREVGFLKDKQQQSSSSLWQRYFTNERSLPITLAIAIYQTLAIYQKLLFEDVICYKKPASYLWDNINRLYDIARQQQAVDMNLKAYIPIRSTHTIHQLYCQLCLHHLLNVRALRRSRILLLHRLLPEWSGHMVATIEPQSATRLFVHIQGKEPPTYLTASTTINLHDEPNTCLFIELESLVASLQLRTQALINADKKGAEYYLINAILMTISYRYINPKLMLPIVNNTKQIATILTGFNDIHYYVSHKKSLCTLIESKALPHHHQPRYDTLPKYTSTYKELKAYTFEADNQLSSFRILRLIPSSDESNAIDQSLKSSKASLASKKAVVKKNHVKGDDIDNIDALAPPLLPTMSLFLLNHEQASISPNSNKCSMGVVRWLNFEKETAEIEWQVLGHKLIACGVRLQDRDQRSQHFVPAFVIEADKQLQTSYSLLLPPSHFRTDDRVMMRLNNQQKTLRLGRRLMTTDEFSQYEVCQA